MRLRWISCAVDGVTRQLAFGEWADTSVGVGSFSLPGDLSDDVYLLRLTFSGSASDGIVESHVDEHYVSVAGGSVEDTDFEGWMARATVAGGA